MVYDHSVQRYQIPPEVEQLNAASKAGSLDVVKDLVRQWQAKSPGDPVQMLITALSAAVVNNRPPVVRYLLGQGVPVNEHLFRYATESKFYDILQAFLDHGWNINTPFDSLNPPALAYAVLDEELTKWFLDRGANPNAQGSRDCTPLSWAVRDAPLTTIQLLFNHGGTVHHGQLLHHAAQRELPDRVEVFNFLLEQGASESINKIMYQDREGDYLMNMYTGIGTPLQLAAGKGFLDLVKLLIKKGADPLIKDPRGKTALDRAIFGNHTEVIEFLSPMSVPSSVPRHDFSDTEGFHYHPVPLIKVLGAGWDKVHYI
ncbi:hypothetical protein DTO063F5_3799 [Paecilomyces variotii]|nr:hypothetical protein DTO063F5_3799 [Paecilomyces variotii]